DSTVAGYHIARRLGSGGTSVVYLARHAERGRPYALKVMRRHLSADAEMAERFQREALVLAALAQPGLPHLVDHGRTGDGAPFLVMNLLVGQTLAERLDLGPMAMPDAVDIARQAACTLSAVHAAGVLHCDVKPDNLFLTPNPLGGARYRVVVIDFGAVSVPDFHAAGPVSSRRYRRLFGTPSYMAPEQCRSGSELDPRTDVYGFGCLLYEMLSGRPPFEGTVAQILAAHQAAVRPRVSALCPDVPADLDLLIASMIASDPDRRPPSMSAVERALAETMLPPPIDLPARA
ncbi:MAG TPA: serine/threonine-protein kinase, partial [Candidatus Acidoferrum sp.]|nr:serine/threonine-protein kinase [Candidatus Acidoferrum sp.]